MRSPVILRVFKGHQLKEVKQFDLEQIVIGHQADVQLDLDDPKISPIHCMIELRENGYHLCDLGSEYGTLKNGLRVLDEPLNSNDEIIIGEYKIVFFSGVPKPKSPVFTASTIKDTPTSPPAVKIPDQRPSDVGGLQVNTHRPLIKETKASTIKVVNSKKTFAPPSQIPDLKTYLKPHKGGSVEVLVSWRDRILQASHFRTKGVVRINAEEGHSLALPYGILPKNFKLMELSQGARVFFPTETQGELVAVDQKFDLVTLQRNGRIQPAGQNISLKLEQNEVLHLALAGSEVQIIIRYVPLTPVVPLIPPLMLSSGELMGLLLAVAISLLLYLGISTMHPAEPLPEEEDLTRVAQIIFDNKPPVPNPPPPEQIPQPEEVKKTPPPPPEPPQKVQASEKDQKQQKKGEEVKSAKSNQRAGRAAEVAPNPNAKNKPKTFTSVKQGGAVKIGNKNSGNANSQVKDVTKVGLFSAFGTGGVRKQLDQAYSGAGDILGTAGEATGSTGMGENRPGEDLGSKFKDTGAGGKGTAIQGISGINTKGRSTGMGTYGASEGFGDKTSVAIEPGGQEENFVGTIDREAVRRVVRAHLNQITACYTRELNKLDRSQRSQLEGKVILKWEIIEKGAAQNVRVLSSTLNNRSIEECMKQRLATWQFPEPPSGLVGEITYPFLLKPIN